MIRIVVVSPSGNLSTVGAPGSRRQMHIPLDPRRGRLGIRLHLIQAGCTPAVEF
jgi:hypothetical protein